MRLGILEGLSSAKQLNLACGLVWTSARLTYQLLFLSQINFIDLLSTQTFKRTKSNALKSELFLQLSQGYLSLLQ
jgi:hypothetical protein